MPQREAKQVALLSFILVMLTASINDGYKFGWPSTFIKRTIWLGNYGWAVILSGLVVDFLFWFFFTLLAFNFKLVLAFIKKTIKKSNIQKYYKTALAALILGVVISALSISAKHSWVAENPHVIGYYGPGSYDVIEGSGWPLPIEERRFSTGYPAGRTSSQPKNAALDLFFWFGISFLIILGLRRNKKFDKPSLLSSFLFVVVACVAFPSGSYIGLLTGFARSGSPVFLGVFFSSIISLVFVLLTQRARLLAPLLLGLVLLANSSLLSLRNGPFGFGPLSFGDPLKIESAETLPDSSGCKQRASVPEASPCAYSALHLDNLILDGLFWTISAYLITIPVWRHKKGKKE